VAVTAEKLQQIDLFEDLDRKELRALANSFKERTFGAGETVVSEDKGGVGFFVIDEGQAKVTIRGDERATLGPGDHFGEIALIDEGVRTATVTAETELRCHGLTSWAFRPLVEHNPTIAWRLLRVLSQRLREAHLRELDV
jgi:CRP-like cAMP-binding protein